MLLPVYVGKEDHSISATTTRCCGSGGVINAGKIAPVRRVGRVVSATRTKVLQRRRPQVSFPSFEALPRCVDASSLPLRFGVCLRVKA